MVNKSLGLKKKTSFHKRHTYKKHKSDTVIEDIIGGFRVFLVSVFLIYFGIEIINSLPGVSLPITGNSQWVVSLINGLFLVFVSYVKRKNKEYFT